MKTYIADSSFIDNFAQWAITKHADTNHMYDTYLPYEFHLRMVYKAALDWQHLLTADRDAVLVAAWGHDLIEDARVSYNDIVTFIIGRLGRSDKFAKEVAETIFAVTNNRGRNRKERANRDYYDGIKLNKSALFVKLADRIANLQYSKMTGSRQYEMYQREMLHFCSELDLNGEDHQFAPMIEYMKSI